MRTPTIVFSWFRPCQDCMSAYYSLTRHKYFCFITPTILSTIHPLLKPQSINGFARWPTVCIIYSPAHVISQNGCLQAFFLLQHEMGCFYPNLPQEIQNRIKDSYIYVCKYQHIHHICIIIISHVHVCHMKSRPVFFRRRCCFALYRCDCEYWTHSMITINILIVWWFRVNWSMAQR